MERDSYLRFYALAGLVALLLVACSGANGDPAPAVVEAGAEPSVTGCVDAGATE